MSGATRIRFMRLMVFFDLPTNTAAERKTYTTFRKFLLKDGYLMLQESVYVKLVVNDGMADSAVYRLRNNAPSKGLVQVLKVTETQFATMEFITGRELGRSEVSTMDDLIII